MCSTDKAGERGNLNEERLDRMSLYKITPLHLGDITRPKSNMIYGYEGKEVQDFPLIAYYLEGEHKILVDTGGSSPDSEAGKKAAPYKRSADQELGNALRAIGVSPEDIEYVIFTHLHWDHAGNNHLFPHATMLCQKSELEGISDGEDAGKGYDIDYISGFQYRMIDGDQKLFNGISVILAPGHTVGMQCVAAETDAGVVLLTGDLITLRESLSYDPPRFNALLYSESAFEVAQRSFDKLTGISQLVLPGHDPGVFAPGMGL